MQALIEAEQLKHYLESSKPKRVKRLEWNEAEGRLEEVDQEVFEQAEENNGLIQGDGILLTMDNKKVDLNLLQERNIESNKNLPEDLNKKEDDNSNLNYNFQNARAKLLAIMKSKVAMFVPGAGVKQFHFSHIFADEDKQSEV